MKLTWQPISTKPTSQRVFSALIAARDEEGAYLCNELHLWNGIEWRSEDDGRPLRDQHKIDYWWLAEADLVAPFDGLPVDIQFVISEPIECTVSGGVAA